ncbi:MAG: Methyltransferase domain protein [candidate division WS6 bacterium OLB20]|uniref:Methyltransferase domain protein n=1 Tax=candidate division WS6 bacterium OLB20 TaxID=1617426 RepID=A0A136LW38_9BACT|nr:MAG: Methyltransferase domain protein [candidate division WS6 bacterium OLB20]
MTPDTIQKLNSLNIRMYRNASQDFSDSRSEPWDGWVLMLEEFKKLKFQPLHVLDVACGNARFYDFLRSKFKVDYRGMDTSEELLSIAALRNPDLKLFKHDILEYPWPVGHFDLVAAFGITHHLPGISTRQVFFSELSKHIDLQGYTIFTTWNFKDQPWLIRRQHSWAEIGLSPEDVDQGDFLLDWKGDPRLLRYAHAYTQDEVRQLCTNAGLEIVSIYTADGRNGNGNTYYIARKIERVFD